MSRLGLAREAVRPALKGRMMISGPPGSGKTRTALMIAEVLAEGGPVLMIDTEKESALTYADDFTFKHLPWEAPFDPRELTVDILAAGQTYDVVIVDSGSHFWRANGGTLDIANGKFTGWAEARPAQEDLVQAILSTDAHVVFCTRSKMKHEQVVENGKHVVKKLGMGAIQDDDLEYEVNVSIDIDMGHTLAVAKSRTVALPVGREFKPGHATDMAELYRDWLKKGEPPVDRVVIDKLVERMNALPDGPRKGVKQEFVATIGRPDHLRESQLDAAVELIRSWEERNPDNTNKQGAGPADVPVEEPSGDADGHQDEPAATGPAPTDRPVGVRDVAMRADEVFGPLGDLAPKGRQTKTQDGLRHALVFELTGGEAVSLKALNPAQLHIVMGWLDDIDAQRINVAVDHDPAKGIEITWADFSTTTFLWSELADTEKKAKDTEAAA